MFVDSGSILCLIEKHWRLFPRTWKMPFNFTFAVYYGCTFKHTFNITKRKKNQGISIPLDVGRSALWCSIWKQLSLELPNIRKPSGTKKKYWWASQKSCSCPTKREWSLGNALFQVRNTFMNTMYKSSGAIKCANYAHVIWPHWEAGPCHGQFGSKFGFEESADSADADITATTTTAQVLGGCTFVCMFVWQGTSNVVGHTQSRTSTKKLPSYRE